MTKYIIVHTMHEGCHNYKTIEEEKTLSMMNFVKINKPKVFLFDDKFQANEFFHDYMNDVDCIDIRCRKGNDIEHIDYCTCGIVEMDHDGHPVLFYNKVHQIFLLESGAQAFMPSKNTRIDINNMNLSANHIKNCKNMSKHQRKVYIELGRVCQECENGNFEYDTDTDEDINGEYGDGDGEVVQLCPPEPPIKGQKKPKK